MLDIIKNFAKPSKVALAALLSVVAITANAAPDSDGTSANTLEDVSSILDNTYLGISVPQGAPGGIPEGTAYNYEYTHDEEGIHITAGASARYKQSFGKYVNTSSETVTVLNVSAGLNAGVSLGCNGLDMGLESLFQFDAGDILKYLPKYIMTNLATEALAQIYATPLISAVMDGLKAMQNFTAEFQQASCNMADVKSRASEIRKARIDECVEEKTMNGKANDAAMAECEDPGKLTRRIKAFQNFVSGRESTGTSISKLLSDNGVPYGNGSGTNLGSGISTGSLMKMFIPDIKFSVNGGSSESKRAELDIGNIYNKASSEAYNAISGIYDDVILTIRKARTITPTTRDEMLESTQQYKDFIMVYGSQSVYQDTEAENTETRTDAQINEIKQQYATYAKVTYKTPKALKGYKQFVIGPDDGPDDAMTNMVSDFQNDGRSILLSAGNDCWAKVYKNTKENTGKYKWLQVHKSPSAAVSSGDISLSSVGDDIIAKLAQCKAINNVNLVLAKSYQDRNRRLKNAYIKSVAAQSALDATENIVLLTNNKIDELLSTESDKLMAQCNDIGVGNLPATATTDDNQTNQPYSSCDQYVKQNKMKPEKIAFLNAQKDQLTASVANLEKQVEVAKKEFESFEKMYAEK
jgi:hypothetical protein